MNYLGYGVVTPSTVVGRIFCIGYSTLGIPLMMITIANIGKFVSLVIVAATRVALRMGRRLNSSLPGRVKVPIEIVVTDIDTNDIPDEEQKLSLTGLAIASLFTLIVGTMTVWHYENLDFFPSLYFCFISLTTGSCISLCSFHDCVFYVGFSGTWRYLPKEYGNAACHSVVA